MVTEKNNDVQHDFFKDPIRLRLDNGWIKAEGTTLGAGAGPKIALSAPLTTAIPIVGQESLRVVVKCRGKREEV